MGGDNTAIGGQALIFNTVGFGNVAVGNLALTSNTAGNGNTAVGVDALGQATGSRNIALGPEAGQQVTTASDVICIGHTGANVDNSCFISQIFGKPVGNDAVAVLVDSFGKLGTMSSSRRFKNEIKPMDKASEAIFALKPMTFQYKTPPKRRALA
jgi:Chaperone of endosialidase